MDVCSFCQVSIRPLKNHLDFFTTTVAVGVMLVSCRARRHFMIFHGKGFRKCLLTSAFPIRGHIQPFLPGPGLAFREG